MRRFLNILIGIFTPAAVYAQVHLTDYGFDCSQINAPIPGCGSGIDLTLAAAAKVSGTLLYIATPLATVILLYGAVRMIVSRGDEGKEAGKKAMIYGAMGLAFVTLSGAIVGLVNVYIYRLP
jgi:hypothetical protein